MNRLFLIFSLVLIISACSSSNDPEQKMPPTEVNTLKLWINSDMNSLTLKLRQYADSIKINGSDSTNIREVLIQLMGKSEFAYDITFISSDGIITIVEPSDYSVVINKNLNQEESYQRMLQTKDVVFSYSFDAWEGVRGATLVVPIYQDDVFIGALSALIDVNEYLKGLIYDLKLESGLTLWAFENIGTVLIYRKNEEIGKNIFYDEYFDADFRAACETIISSLSGNTSYKYTDGNNQTKSREVWWNTVKIHGVEWKIVSEQE